MLNEFATKCVEALESGKYKQTTGHLGDKDGFCCLGVMCEVHAKEDASFPIKKIYLDSQDSGDFVYSYGPENEKNTQTLPMAVKEKLDMQWNNGEFYIYSVPKEIEEIVLKYKKADDYNPTMITLAMLNDRGATFEEIAKVIRAEPQGLFKV